MVSRQIAALTAALLLAAGAAPAGAGNLEKLAGFKVTGTSLDIPTVPQDPAYIAQLRKNLEHVKLPPGFKLAYPVITHTHYM